MYKKILVPLDGSELAECVFSHVEAIANGCGSPAVVLVRSVEPFYMPTGGEYVPSPQQIEEIQAATMQEATDYLAQAVKRLKYNGTKKTEILNGRPADAIAEYSTKNNVDLIVIATHGRSGISRWVMGSVADRVLRSACVPIFMVRAPGCIPGI